MRKKSSGPFSEKGAPFLEKARDLFKKSSRGFYSIVTALSDEAYPKVRRSKGFLEILEDPKEIGDDRGKQSCKWSYIFFN